MKSFIKLFTVSALLLGATVSQAASLTFVNNLDNTINVTVNGNASIGVPLPPGVTELSYMKVQAVCIANLFNCHVDYNIDGTKVGWAEFDAWSHKLNDYAIFGAYDVAFGYDKEGGLAKVTFNNK